MSYISQPNDLQDRVGSHGDFVHETIACTSFSGVSMEANRSMVHQYIVSFTLGHTTEDWIKHVERHKNGRRTTQDIRDHFFSEGNATKRIAEVERRRDSLHYKNEISLSFKILLAKCQKMFNISRDEQEEMDEKAKIRYLFKSVKSSGLFTSYVAPITYTTCANHLSTVVSEFADYLSKKRNVSQLTSGDHIPTIHNDNGSINTSFITDIYKLSQEDKKLVTY